jgi:hypothetical protein
MQPIVRNIRDIEADERLHLERLLGHRLRDDQQLIIQIVNLTEPSVGEPQAGVEPSAQHDQAAGQQPAAQLPDWCNVYEGLNEQEIEEIEEVILTRADLTRTSE